MTLLNDIAEFSQRLRVTVEEFRRQEEQIREQYARAEATGSAIDGEMLERPTRRFLIDALLKALDWNPDDPAAVAEEARARSGNNDRLYFDYLGLAPGTHLPVLLFEAKGFDVAMPRKPREAELDALDMATLIAKAVDALKRGDTSLPIVSQWAEFLRDLHTYIGSLDELGQMTLRRAAITAGRWIIVFREPVATFRQPSEAKAEHIVCFTSLDDMLTRHGDLYRLLHRGRLVDTLPPTLKVSEALRMIPADRIRSCSRAVLVATTMSSGARRQQYPTRSVYTAVLVQTGDRWFAIVDYEQPIEEPKREQSIEEFLAKIGRAGASLEQRLCQRFGRSLQPMALDEFPGFPASTIYRERLSAPIDPVAGSAAERAEDSKSERLFMCHSGEIGAPAEFVVATGTDWFYKSNRQAGAECSFHFWKAARQQNVTSAELHTGYVTDSFTEDGQHRHCAHGDLLSLRAERCHIRAIESHLCCQACIFAADCWSAEKDRLPCPK